MANKNAKAAARPCPTCPDGLCPPINTLPRSPQPEEERIAAAARAIPDALAEQFRAGKRYEAVASELVEWLRRPKYGRHLLPAAEWAIHRLVRERKLSVHVKVTFCRPASIERPVRRFVDGKLLRSKPEPFLCVYSKIDNPTHFDTFVVRAEEVLWTFWRERKKVRTVEEPRTYLAADLYKELDVCDATLRKYATDAGVTIPEAGYHNHRYTEDERRSIFQQMASNASYRVAERARTLLAETMRKPN